MNYSVGLSSEVFLIVSVESQTLYSRQRNNKSIAHTAPHKNKKQTINKPSDQFSGPII
jgi:hypothetical protein